jgi:inorganic triphosphatase YgiF
MSHAETELKLLLPGAQAATIEAQLRKLGVLARRRATTQCLSNIYYDTPEQTLRQQRLALRMRRISDLPSSSKRSSATAQSEWVQTFKTAGLSQGGLSQRGEWESRERSSQLNPSALRATPWAKLDPDGRLFDALQPCFETRCRRTIWNLHRYQGASIEIALDVGEITAEGRSVPILELELELKSGPPEALFHLAQEIAGHVAVLPCDASKAERGYQLAQGIAHPARFAKPVHLGVETEPLVAAQTALAETYEQLTRNLASLLADDDPEVVHQARVAWRRWRSALVLFAPWLSHRPEAAGLKPLLNALGPLRDLDVLRTDTLGRWLPAFIDGDAQRQHTATRALKQIDLARSVQRERTRSALAAPATGRALLSLANELFALATSDAAQPSQGANDAKSATSDQRKSKTKVQKHSPWALKRITELQRRMERVLKASEKPKASVEQIHRARLQAKKTRYAAEMLRDLLPAKRSKTITQKATAVQTRVGEDRDLQQAVVLLQALKADPALIAFLRGVHAGR